MPNDGSSSAARRLNVPRRESQSVRIVPKFESVSLRFGAWWSRCIAGGTNVRQRIGSSRAGTWMFACWNWAQASIATSKTTSPSGGMPSTVMAPSFATEEKSTSPV